MVTPPAGELGSAVHDGDDLNALAAGVRQPGRQQNGQIWVTSSKPMSSGGSSRHDSEAWPICAAA